MKLEEYIELLHRSSQRLVSALADPRKDVAWLFFMRREGWIHLGLTIKTLWKIIWWEKGD